MMCRMQFNFVYSDGLGQYYVISSDAVVNWEEEGNPDIQLLKTAETLKARIKCHYNNFLPR